MPRAPRFRVPTPIGSKPTLNRMIRLHSKQTVRCPGCSEHLSLEDYVHKHSLERHGWDCLRVCIYCSGEERWPTVRHRNFTHIVPCLKRFLQERVPIGESSEEVEPTIARGSMPCEECPAFVSRPRDMHGRGRIGGGGGGGERDAVSDYVGLYDSCYERPEAYGESAITFTEESGLGRDVYAVVQKFLRGDMVWYHLMIHHQNFDNFVRAFRNVRDQIFVPPFWCLCDGLTVNRRTHRHMILAVEPEVDFKHIWENEVRYRLEDGGQSKKCIRIEKPFHLIRTIQYVSQRNSSCDGNRIRDAVEEDGGGRFRYSHFYINRPLHEHAIVCMSMMFEGGLKSLVDEQNKNKDVEGWLEHVRELRDVHYNSRYAVPIGVTGFKFLNCVLPLSRELEPSEEETPLWLHWHDDDDRLYLKTDPSLRDLTSEEWYARQVERGNTLTHIFENWYVLYLTQQKVMRQLKMALYKQESRDQRTRKEMLRERDARVTALESENADLRQRVTALESENADLRRRITALEAEFADARRKTEIAKALEAELAELRRETETATALKAENAYLRRRMETLTALKAEISKLRRENADSRRKMELMSYLLPSRRT